MSSPISSKNSIDTLLIEALNHNVRTCEPLKHGIKHAYSGKLVEVGDRFVFDVHHHDTGNSVRGWILMPDGKHYMFLNGTFWFSERYCFNEFKQKHGVWDESLAVDLLELRQLVESAIWHKEHDERQEHRAQQEAKDKLKQQVEATFKKAGAA